jgi:hypothetical protein
MSLAMASESLLAVLKPKRIIRKHMDANCSSFHLRVFLGLSNCDTPSVTVVATVLEQLFTRYSGSLKEILASLGCISNIVRFESQISNSFILLRLRRLALVL